MSQPPYTADNLPGGLAKLNSSRKKERAKGEKRIPKWIRETSEEADALRQRVTQTFELHTQHTPIAEIVETVGVSIPTIYDYLRKARYMRAMMMANEINYIMIEAVASRQQIIRDIRKSLRDMRNVSISPEHTLDRLNAAAAAGFNEPVNGNNGHDAENPAPEGLVMIGVTPDMVKVELEGYRLIGEQEKAIEELLGLRDKHAAAGAPRIATTSPVMTGNIYLIDASIREGEEVLGNGRMTIIPANDPRLETIAEEEPEDDDEDDYLEEDDE